MFILPMSLAAAVTIRVGFHGQSSTLDAQTAARTAGRRRRYGCLYGALYRCITREQVPLLYNDNPEVVGCCHTQYGVVSLTLTIRTSSYYFVQFRPVPFRPYAAVKAITGHSAFLRY